jgi:ankyrin repeat protein
MTAINPHLIRIEGATLISEIAAEPSTRRFSMPLLHLPNEMLIEIARSLWEENDLNAFVRVNRHLYTLLSAYLYAHNLRRFEDDEIDTGSAALIWAIIHHGPEATYKLALDAERNSSPSSDIRPSDCALKLALVLERVDALTLLFENRDYHDVDKQAILKAARIGNVDVFRTMIESGFFEPSYADERGMTSLMEAAIRGHADIARYLLGFEEVDLNARWDGGFTPLYMAVEDGHVEIIKMLVATGKVDVSAENAYGVTVLSKAVRANQPECVRALLEDDSLDPNAGAIDMMSPLQDAAFWGELETVNLLLEGGADPNFAPTGTTALSIAAKEGHQDVVDTLLGVQGILIDSQPHFTQSWLLDAVIRGRVSLVETLLAQPGINANEKNDDGNSLLIAGITEGQTETVFALLASGNVDVNLTGRLRRTPLHVAVHRGHADIVRRLLSVNGIDPNSRDWFGETPFGLALIEQDHEILFMLLEVQEVLDDAIFGLDKSITYAEGED